MPPRTTNSLPVSVQRGISTYSGTYGVDPLFAQAIAVRESGGSQSAVSTTGAIGIMQLEPDTFYGLSAPPGQVFQSTGTSTFTNINDPQQNMEAGVYYLAQQQANYNGDLTLTAAAYNAGPGAVDGAGGVPQNSETPGYVTSVSGIYTASGGDDPTLSTRSTQQTVNNSPVAGNGNPPLGPGSVFQLLTSNATPSSTTFAANAPSIVILQGLDAAPWYTDPALVVGNRPARSRIAPVKFKIVLNDTAQDFVLSSKGASGAPIEIQLNTNLKSFSKSMRHQYVKTKTRTGFHLTLWGMQADVVTGSGSTGVMMNQLGLTDFMSVANVSQQLITLVQSGFSHTSSTIGPNMPDFSPSGVILDTSPDVFTSTVRDKDINIPGSFRVAAQDAFAELLAAFKNNGIVWFNKDFKWGDYPASDQVGPSAWSPQLAASSSQVLGRNNDVMTRGAVLMYVEGEIFEGYFKNLSWTQDALNPFQWHFNFSFQVERTLSLLYYPQGVTSQGSIGQNDLSDISFADPQYAEIAVSQLPIRGEEQVIPSQLPLETANSQMNRALEQSGSSGFVTVEKKDFFITAALKPFVDYVVVNLPHRGLTAQGHSDPSTSASYRFLINPATVQINRQTIDQQTLTRAGWQFGVWGEDTIRITMEGKTAAQYFSLGLTDEFHLFTESYRNLQQLKMVIANNGYWFEGEQTGSTPVSGNFTRKRIKMHQDIELLVGNYIWYGMFENLDYTSDADSPFNYEWSLTFIAWKERFRSGSPYPDTIHNDVQRGHSYSSFQTTQQAATTLRQQQNAGIQSLPSSAPLGLNPAPQNGGPIAPSVTAAQQSELALNMDPTAFDQNYNLPIMDPAASGIFI